VKLDPLMVRAFDAKRSNSQAAPLPLELDRFEAQGWEATERQATNLAARLGVGLSEILAPGQEQQITWALEELARLRGLLDLVEKHLRERG